MFLIGIQVGSKPLLYLRQPGKNTFLEFFHPAGLKGQFCEINIDECEEKPCGILSMCEDALNGYRCFCAPGFIGN